MSERFSKSFTEYVCDYEDQLKTVFYFSVAVLVLTLFSLPFFEPDSASYVVSVLNAGGLLCLAGVTGYFIYRC